MLERIHRQTVPKGAPGGNDPQEKNAGKAGKTGKYTGLNVFDITQVDLNRLELVFQETLAGFEKR